MPPSLIFDISNVDLNKVLVDQEGIRAKLPQRHEFEMLNGITWCDTVKQEMIGFKDVGKDEFWARGHIPGRPVFPGVLQLELAAQVSSFYTASFIAGWDGFIGFGGLEEVKFRGQVVPGDRIYVLVKHIWERHRRICCKTQGLVNGNIVFEATIIGVKMG